MNTYDQEKIQEVVQQLYIGKLNMSKLANALEDILYELRRLDQEKADKQIWGLG